MLVVGVSMVTLDRRDHDRHVPGVCVFDPCA